MVKYFLSMLPYIFCSIANLIHITQWAFDKSEIDLFFPPFLACVLYSRNYVIMSILFKK